MGGSGGSAWLLLVTQSDTGNAAAARERGRFQTGTDNTWMTDVHEKNMGVLYNLVCVCSVANGNGYMCLHKEDFRK